MHSPVRRSTFTLAALLVAGAFSAISTAATHENAHETAQEVFTNPIFERATPERSTLDAVASNPLYQGGDGRLQSAITANPRLGGTGRFQGSNPWYPV